MKNFESPSIVSCSINDTSEGTYVGSGYLPNDPGDKPTPTPSGGELPDIWSFFTENNWGHDGGSHTDGTLVFKHSGQGLDPNGHTLVCVWSTDFKINSIWCVSGTAQIDQIGDQHFRVKYSGCMNRGERIGVTIGITGETEYGSTAIGKSGNGENSHTRSFTCTNWHYE